jgi:TRAP transporter TAXI family solute receptor
VVTSDSKIVNIEDLIGKRVSFEAKGSMSETTALAVMNAAGITPDKIRSAGGVVTNSSYQAMADGLADGNLDAAWFNSPGKRVHATFLAVNERFGLRLVKVSDAVIDKVIKENPTLGKTTIPAGIYKGNTAPVTFVGGATQMYVRGDLPEDFVYAVVSTIYKPEYTKSITEKFDLCFDFGTVDAGLIGANHIPMHSGAAKYFRDDRKADLAARGITVK